VLTRTTFDEVADRISALIGLPAGRIGPDTALSALAVDSFRMVELVVDLQEEFDSAFGQAELALVSTVGELADLLAGESATASAAGAPRPVPTEAG